MITLSNSDLSVSEVRSATLEAIAASLPKRIDRPKDAVTISEVSEKLNCSLETARRKIKGLIKSGKMVHCGVFLNQYGKTENCYAQAKEGSFPRLA